MEKTEIAISNISYNIKGKVILKNISLDIKEGDSFALLGENGAGKSTLIDVILGDISPSEGNIYFKNNLKRHFDNMGILYNNMPLFRMLKAGEVIKYFSTLYKIDYTEVKNRYFEIFEIEGINNSFIQALSDGEKKRIGLLLTIMHEPDMLILDEPFANIDPLMINRIWNSFKQRKRTIFFTTHNWEAAAKFSDKICFIYKGEIINEPLHPLKIIKSLPASKKIILKADTKTLKNISDYQYYEYDGNLNVFFDHGTDLLNLIKSFTYNFSVQDVDLKDAYLYYIKRI